jgi:hypothetical protein
MAKPFNGVINVDIRDSKPDWTPFEAPKAPEGAANVVYIVLDDVGFAAMGCYGGPVETPNMDRIADRGLRYTQWHTTALCSPTRSCLLTGRNHTRNSMACITEAATGFPNASGSGQLESRCEGCQSLGSGRRRHRRRRTSSAAGAGRLARRLHSTTRVTVGGDTRRVGDFNSSGLRVEWANADGLRPGAAVDHQLMAGEPKTQHSATILRTGGCSGLACERRRRRRQGSCKQSHSQKVASGSSRHLHARTLTRWEEQLVSLLRATKSALHAAPRPQRRYRFAWKHFETKSEPKGDRDATVERATS